VTIKPRWTHHRAAARRWSRPVSDPAATIA
jgi:hypothetical protein